MSQTKVLLALITVAVLVPAGLNAAPPKAAPKAAPAAAPAAPPMKAYLPKVTIEAARTTALAKVAGTVKNEELEEEGGIWIYTFIIKPRGEKGEAIKEVNVNAETGKIVVVEDETETMLRDEQAKAALLPKGPAGTVTGKIGGKPFEKVISAHWIGKPGNPARTFVFIFDQPISCTEISAKGWDDHLKDKAQHLEMKFQGLVPGGYKVIPGKQFAAMEGGAGYAQTQAGSPALEIKAKGGTLTLGALKAAKKASGAFDISFGTDGSLKGSFDADWCPGGVEP